MLIYTYSNIRITMSDTVEQLGKLDITQFNIDMKNDLSMRTNIAVIGLGATGSSFLLPLAHYLNYYSRNEVHLFDYDTISNTNRQVSMYGFTEAINVIHQRRKVETATNILKKFANHNDGMGFNKDYSMRNYNNIHSHNKMVDARLLNVLFNNNDIDLDYIFVFTDNNESRHEISKYHTENPETVIFDCRVGSYDQYEVYVSRNPEKYLQTIYFEDDGETPLHIETYNVCLEDRMNFSVALTSSSLIMNLFIKHLRGHLTGDFKHIMIGNDFLGEVKGY